MPSTPAARELLGGFFINRPKREPGGISRLEAWWVERQKALEQAGYMLRPRYHPDWKPSWAGTNKYHRQFEDGQNRAVRIDATALELVFMSFQLRLCIDATRISDGKPVMLKRLLIEEGPYELEINRLFSTEPLSSNPRNHCAPHLDVIDLPNDPPIMVHSLLRPFYDPKFQTFGEFVTFFAQVCDGVQFMHVNHIAHRDCTSENIMLDPPNMYPESLHPVDIRRSKDFRHTAKGYSRTRRPTRYLLIDFGLSRRYDPANGPPLDMPICGGDKSAPEHEDPTIPYNPFPTDVYYVGNLVLEDYMEKCHGFEFMKGLIADMVQRDPTKRPTMSEVITRFSEIKSTLSTRKLRSQMARKKEILPVKAWRTVGHWCRTVGYVLTRKAAIPEPK